MTNDPATPPLNGAKLRPLDAQARNLADRLLRGCRHAALGVIDGQSGFPAVSRVLVATDGTGLPALLASGLSAHTRPLVEDGRISLLFGDPGKGDPLAHPRLTLQGTARPLPRGDAEHSELRRRFLNRHPRAALYIDLPDFLLFRVEPQKARLNGGFGKAFAMNGEDLAIASPAAEEIARMEQRALDHMNAHHTEAIAAYAAAHAGECSDGWRMTGIDGGGFEIGKGDRLFRIAFDEPLQSADDLRRVLADMAKRSGKSAPR